MLRAGAGAWGLGVEDLISTPVAAGGAAKGGRDPHPDMPISAGWWLVLLGLFATDKQVRLDY